VQLDTTITIKIKKINETNLKYRIARVREKFLDQDQFLYQVLDLSQLINRNQLVDLGQFLHENQFHNQVDECRILKNIQEREYLTEFKKICKIKK
jgi:hypothetical protein